MRALVLDTNIVLDLLVFADAADQHFIDLAVARRTILLAKDKVVPCMQKRLIDLVVYAFIASAFASNG